ncbi:dephospho-CoA kinase [Hypnocyclicus thermotrophus]|uniref:Dephospho-CoA kinase n=1 Tax=Hypnocyclicus thermotrophus TaxID=1627895 RepID=A0AA46DYN3_9FUSO|nr:dephospho-CoA kinase [Hypnocyclicus thermotrophus]TDT70564.1 dephospho-CoA kinase [Hypnocyclicus thermotrophus]
MILGLTGGIACGKSEVSKIFMELGLVVIDADKISRDVSKKKEVIKEIEKEFGSKVIKNDEVNREVLGKLIFDNKELREKLNGIMHPKIINEIKNQIKLNNDKKNLILDIPLLFEVKLEYLCDKTLLIISNKELQIDRLMKRDNISREYAIKKIESQMSLEEKKELADFIIDNSISREELKEKIILFYNKYLKKNP